MVDGIKLALNETGRRIDEDHYGASFLFRFGSPEDDIVAATTKGFAARLKSSPDRYLVAGDGEAMVQRINEFLEAGCQKFVMLPMANGTKDVMEPTRLFINEVQPAFAP